MATITCPVCLGKRGKYLPRPDGSVEFTACAKCGGTGQIPGSVYLPPPPHPDPDPHHLSLDGTWTLDGGSWTFVRTAAGYDFVEKGALGQVGEGTATLTGKTAVLTFRRRMFGPKVVTAELNAGVLRGTMSLLGMKVPFAAFWSGK